MREIKFRAWDGKRYTTDFFITSEGTVFKPHYDRDAEIVSGFTIEQFTGLHDKNGKEIYEGDILQNDARGHALVVYRYGGFFVELFDCEEFGTTCVPLNEAILFAELIGNIHENPELLND